MQQYLDTLDNILSQGTVVKDRTGSGTIKLFGQNMRFNLREGFPLLTTKEVIFKSVKAELLWFLSGATNAKDLNMLGSKIWDEWATSDGSLGPIYGKQWTAWETSTATDVLNELKELVTTTDVDNEALLKFITNYTPKELDQIQTVIDDINTNPDSRRMIVSGWNPAVLPDDSISPQENVMLNKAALPACHTLFQFSTTPMTRDERIQLYLGNTENRSTIYNDEMYVDNLLTSHGVPDRYLDVSVYLRSQDFMLGTPFNIASYALLLHMVAMLTNTVANDVVWNSGDTHVYLNHLDGAKEQLTRKPGALPNLKITGLHSNIRDFTMDDISILNYNPQPRIKLPISV